MSTQPELKQIPINQIHIKSNYRISFKDASLKELAASIKAEGLIQPVTVRPRAKGPGYELVAGERRYRAHQLAGLATISAVIHDIADADVLKKQIIENVQREAVPFMEAAYGFKRLRDEGDHDVAEIAKIVGKSESFVYMMLQLTNMAQEAQDIASKGWISQIVAFHIARLPNHEYQVKAANDLARTSSGKLVTENGAKSYIRDTFQADSSTALRKKRIKVAGGGSVNDFVANWKYYLVNFDAKQFEAFKVIVRGRTETAVLAEAVDVVMRGGQTDEAAQKPNSTERERESKDLVFSNA